MRTAERFAVPVAGFLLFLASLAPVALADEAPAQQTIQLGLSFSDLGDFGSDWGMRARWSFDNWLVTGGWNNIDETVSSAGGPMKVDGDLWQLDVDYVWWSLNQDSEDRWEREGFYYGLGVGVANIDADWRLAGVTSDAKKVSFAANVVVGGQWKHIFADLRYTFGTDYWDYDSDGVQFSVGGVWPLR
ncbi:MAG: hypothetical protein AB7W28_04985 [Armatimonadota bacterium]